MTEYRVGAGRLAFMAAAALALFLTGAPDAVSSERRIATEEEYRRIAADRKQKADWGYVINLNPAVGGGDRPLGAVRAVDFGVDFSPPARPWAAAASADAPVRGHGGIS